MSITTDQAAALETWFAAAEAGDNATIRALIVAGADLDARDAQERTAFNIASQNRHTDVMTTLLAARQMAFVKRIGFDPFAAAVQQNADVANDRTESRAAG